MSGDEYFAQLKKEPVKSRLKKIIKNKNSHINLPIRHNDFQEEN